MKRILVAGAGGSAAHNFIESLKLSPEEFYIVGTDAKKFHIELSGADVYYQLPRADDADYIPAINRLITKEKIDFIHAQPDIEVMQLSLNRKKILTELWLPKHKTLKIFQDKYVLNQILTKNGLTTAASFFIQNKKTLEEGFRKLKKHHDKIWIRAIRGAGSKAALPVKNMEHASGWIQYWIDVKGLNWRDFMICEFLPGREYAFQSLWKNGELLMSQARERLEYLFGSIMPSGQSSTPSVARTVNNKIVNEAAYKAIRAVDDKADGVFCVDLKEDKNGVPCVTEVNAGRFFTTSNFFSHLGFNMPYYYIKLGLGEKLNGVKLKQFDNLEEDIYWVRMVDMGYKAIRKDKWKIRKI